MSSPIFGINPTSGWINGTINNRNIPKVNITVGFSTANVIKNKNKPKNRKKIR